MIAWTVTDATKKITQVLDQDSPVAKQGILAEAYHVVCAMFYGW